MIIKSFTAPTIAGALKKIREELGGDAIVLKTATCPSDRAFQTGHRFEITACIDESSARKPLPVKADADADIRKLTSPPSNRKVEAPLMGIITTGTTNEKVKAESQTLLADLLDADITFEMAQRIVNEVSNADTEVDNIYRTAFKTLANEIEQHIVTNIKIESGSKIAIIGPSGTGKTSVLGKAAAQLCSKFQHKIKLMTLENYNFSGLNTDNALTENSELQPITESDLDNDGADDTIILIDTPPICLNPEENIDLLEKIKALNPDILFFVFSACSRSADLIEAVSVFESFAPTHLIATHLDETDRWGGLLTLPEQMNIPLAFITNSFGGEGKLVMPDPEIIARHLLNMEVDLNE
jgi:flagellar biosynthesis protein FlhF